MKIICSYTFGVHSRLTEKKLTNFIRHEIAEMKTLKKFDFATTSIATAQERKCSITEVMYWSYILFQVSHSETYKIYCKELVQATCKITSKITM